MCSVRSAFGSAGKVRHRVDAARGRRQRDAVAVGRRLARPRARRRRRAADARACPAMRRRASGRGVRPTAHGVCGSGKSSIFMSAHRAIGACVAAAAAGGLRRMHMRVAPRALRITELRRRRERLELLAPRPRPRQSAQHEKQRAEREPDAADGMQIAPPRASAQRETRRQQRRPSAAPFGHHNAMPVPIITSVQQPASSISEFAGLAEHQPAMQIRGSASSSGARRSACPSTAPVYGFDVDALAFADGRRNTNSALRRGSVSICAVVGTAPRGSLATAFASSASVAQTRRGLRRRRSSGRDKAAARSAAESNTACR